MGIEWVFSLFRVFPIFSAVSFVSVVFLHVLIWVPQFLVDFLFKNLFLEN